MGEPAEVAGVELPDALVHLPDVPLQVLLRVEPLRALFLGHLFSTQFKLLTWV